MKWILVREDNEVKFILSEEVLVYSLGRGKDCLIKCHSLYASRHHCNIINEEGKIYVVDLKSSNGTYVNGLRITPEEPVVLNEKDLLGIGVPEVIDHKSIVFKVVVERNESFNVQNTIKLDGNRKRNLEEPISFGQIPAKIICLDEHVLNGPSHLDRDVNVCASEPISASSPSDNNVSDCAQNNEENSTNRPASGSHNSFSSEPTRQNVTEVIDLVESDDEVVSPVNKDEILTPSKNQDVVPNTIEISGYADENDVIVISDDEDVFFSSSQTFEKVDDVERDEISPQNEGLNEKEEKSWEVSESDEESDNEWWPKLSQSFSENTQEDNNERNEVMEEGKTLGDEMGEEDEPFPVIPENLIPSENEKSSSDEEGEEDASDDMQIDEKVTDGVEDDENTSDSEEGNEKSSEDGDEDDKPLDVEEENPSGNWFPVLSQGFSDSEEEEDDEQQERDEATSMQVNRGACATQDANKINANVEENVGSASVSECAEDLGRIKISRDDELIENKPYESYSSVDSVRNDIKQERSENGENKQIGNSELRLSLVSKTPRRGPLIVTAPMLKRGRICVWEEKEEEPKSSVNVPLASSTPVKSAANLEIKNCQVILEDIMYSKRREKRSRDGGNKCEASHRSGRHKRKGESQRSLSKAEKVKIKEKRKLKLQALSDKGVKDQTSQVKLSSEKGCSEERSKSRDASQDIGKMLPSATEISKDLRPGKVAAKVTAKNRGAFLTEFDLFGPGVSSSSKKDKVRKEKTAKSVIPSKEKTTKNPNYKLIRVSPEKETENATTSTQHTDSVADSVRTPARKHPAPVMSNKITLGILKPLEYKKDINKSERRVSFNDIPEVRHFAVSPGVKMLPVKGKDSPLRAPILQPLCQDDSPMVECSPVMRVVHDICGWNTQWLEEQRSKPCSQPPPVHQNFCLLPILGNYSSYQEYYSCFYPLMMYEIWAKIYKEWDQNFARHQLIQVLLESSKNAPESSLSPGKEFVLVGCQCVISENNTPQNVYPKVGDLCILEFPEEVASGINININQASIVNVRVFAYVESVKRNHITKVTVNQCFGDVQQPAYILNMALKLKKRTHNICIGKMARLKVVCQLQPDLRGFEALLELPKSPLMQHVLNPYSLGLRTFIPGNIRLKSTDLLNSSQEKAVVMAKMVCLAEEPRLCLIQGPPGTGKTKVIVSLLMELFEFESKTLCQKRRDNKTPRILLCAPSNAAIDNLVIKLLAIRTTLKKENRFRLVRVGRLESMNPAVRDISLQELTSKEMNSNSNNPDAESLDLQISTIQAKVNSTRLALESVKHRDDVNNRKNLESKLNEYLQKLEDAKKAKSNNVSGLSNKDKRNLETMAERNVLRCADIVATTLASSVNNSMIDAFLRRQGTKPHFSCCIIDEACQSLEMDSLIPLQLGISNLVLVGDQEQLYPTVLSMVAKQNGLETSLFERLWSSLSADESNTDLPLVLLNVQYRMHPEICYWPNFHVYNGLLETPVDLTMERQSPFLPYVVISLEFDQNDPNQLLNCNEAELVSKLYFAMCEKAEKRNYSIGIITPYQKQKNAIEAAISRRRTAQGKGEVMQFEVNTIDSFQGQERDIVILSCVRSYGIGFLGERRRINVALTRARRSLIVCGNFSSLKNHELWNAFLTDGLSRGLVKCISGSSVPTQKELLNLVLRNS